jgi:hypothetical protein
MRRLLILLVAAACCVGALALVADAAPTQAPRKPFVPKAHATVHATAVASDAARLASMGIETPASTEAAALDSNTAIAKAKQYFAFDSAQAGVTVSAREVRFTLDHYEGALPNGLVPKDLLAWVITVDGLKWHGHGGINTGTPPTFTEMNIVVDANSGAEITEFSFK